MHLQRVRGKMSCGGTDSFVAVKQPTLSVFDIHSWQVTVDFSRHFVAFDQLEREKRLTGADTQD